MPQSFNTWQLFGLILVSAMLWLVYVQSKDRHQPEPRWRILFGFALGIAACGLSVVGYEALDALGVPEIEFHGRGWTAVYCFGIVGPLEEGAKILVAYLFVFRWREYDEPVDGFVYAATIALGFACAENFRTIAGGDWLQQLAYTAALPITHVLFSAIWGLGIAHAHFHVQRRGLRAAWQAGSIALAMFAHGLYDYLLFAFQATLATSALALGIWVVVIWRIHHLHKRAV